MTEVSVETCFANLRVLSFSLKLIIVIVSFLIFSNVYLDFNLHFIVIGMGRPFLIGCTNKVIKHFTHNRESLNQEPHNCHTCQNE